MTWTTVWLLANAHPLWLRGAMLPAAPGTVVALQAGVVTTALVLRWSHIAHRHFRTSAARCR